MGHPNRDESPKRRTKLGATVTPPAPRAPLTPPAVGYRQSFEKPTGAAPPLSPPLSPPTEVPTEKPTEAIEFPPVVNFPPAPDVPPAVQVGSPVEMLAAYPPAPAVPPRLRRRPSRRVAAALLAIPVLLAIVAAGVSTRDDESAPTIPPPGDGSLSQQLDELDSAIDLVAK